MRQLAQFVKTTSGRIPFKSVDGTTHPPDHLLISRAGLEFEPCFVEGMQQFVGALKKKRAQLRATILGRMAHEFASVRWYAVPLFSCTMRNFWDSKKRLSACPTKRSPPGFRQCQNFSTSRFCSASSK